MPEHPLAKLRPRVRAELKRKRAERGDHATCPACEMTVLVDPRVAAGRLTEHRPVPAADVCPASGWWRCYECLDGDGVDSCTFCARAGWSPPSGGGTSIQTDGGLRISGGGAPRRPGEIPDPPADAPTTETWTEYRVADGPQPGGAHPDERPVTVTTRERDQVEAWLAHWRSRWDDARIESRTRTETAWTEVQP